MLEQETVATLEPQAPEAIADGGKVGGEPQEPDVKAELAAANTQLEALKKEKADLEQRFKSAKGNLDKQLNIEAELGRVRRETTAQRELLTDLVKAVISGDSEAVTKAVNTHAQRQSEDDAADAYSSAAAAIYEDVKAELEDIGLKPDAPELQEAFVLWNEGLKLHEGKSFGQALRTFVTARNRLGVVRREIQKQRKADDQAARAKETEEKAEKIAQGKLREAGLYKTPKTTPSPSADGNPYGAMSLDELQAVNSSKIPLSQTGAYLEALTKAEQRERGIKFKGG